MKILRRFCILFLIIGIWSCDTENMFVGAGNAPDISAPELIISTPANLAYESGDFVMSGTAFDNLKVTKVELKVYCNGVRISDLQNPPLADIAGDKWSYNFKNLQSGEYTITAIAHDRAGNTSEKSSKSIVVTVDNEPSKVVIQKPNLKPQATLEGLNYRDYTYIEYFQNKTFSIRGSIDDEYPLKEITLQLLKDTECVYSLTFDSKYLGRKSGNSMVEGSLYNWIVTIDSEEKPSQSETYINKLASLSATEKHYLKVAVIVTDKAGNKTLDTNMDLGFICLYQDADRPWITVSSLVNEDTLELQQEKNKLRAGAQISGTAYDDDLLDTMEFRIVNTDYDEIVKEEVVSKASFGDTGCTVWSLIAPTNQGRYRLYYRVKDNQGVKSYGDEETEWSDADSIGFQVIDESAPMTEIATFEEYPVTAYIGNENPAIVIDAVTRDAVGISEVILAWVPDVDEKKIEKLKKNKWNITSDGYNDGIKYWIVNLANFKNVLENTTYKMEWSCELPVSDFVAEDGSGIYNYKKMYYCTVSKSGNYAVGTFTIPKEFNVPELQIESPKDNEKCRNINGTYFSISGTCKDEESGLTSLVIKYKKSTGEDAQYDLLKEGKLSDDGKWSITSDLLENLGGSYQRIIVEACDNFNNINRSSVYIVVDNNSPQVSSITLTEPSGYYSIGQTLNFKVTMNREVVIENGKNLKLELNCNKDKNGTPVFAEFDGIEDYKFLLFKYTVKDGDFAEPLDYYSTDSLKIFGGTTITEKGEGDDGSSTGVPAILTLPNPGESGSLAARGIFIDTAKPFVKEITADVGAGAYKAGTQITISAQFNENVSGRARILLNSRGKDPSQTHLFISMDKEVDNEDVLEFPYTVEKGDNVDVLDIYVPFYAYSDTVTVKDAAGNIMDFENFPHDNVSGSLANLKIKIDTTAPVLEKIYVTEINTQPYSDGKYYLNTGKTVTFQALFTEPIMLGTEQPYLELTALNSKDEKVHAQYQSGAGSSLLTFVYTVAYGENLPEDLACTALVGDVTDVAGNPIDGSAGNRKEYSEVLGKVVTVGNSSSYPKVSIIVDTVKPQPPVFDFNYVNGGEVITDFDKKEERASGNIYKGRDSGYTKNIEVTASPVGEETTAVMEIFASVGGITKQEWAKMTSYSTVTANAEENWIVKAQLKDYAGNVSDISSASFMIDNGVPLLFGITTTLTDGLYNTGAKIPVVLTFSKKVNVKKSGSNDIKVIFNNGGTAVISENVQYNAAHKTEYVVGNGDSDVEKLEVVEITGGNFFDTAGNKVAVTTEGLKLTTSEGFADDFKIKNIKIDNTAPQLINYAVESISNENNSDNDYYYLNAEKSVKIAANFNEPVMITDDSEITLSHNDVKATYIGAGNGNKTLYFNYTVNKGETSSLLGIASSIYPGNIQDEAGNLLAAGLAQATTLEYKGKNIKIDTTAPTAPTVTLKKQSDSNPLNNNDTVSEQVTMSITGEEGAVISYSINGGANYEIGTSKVLGDTGSKKTFYIVTRQVDKAGNMSPTSDKMIITVDLQEMGLSKITTNKADGTYKAGDTIAIILLFTKKVSYENLQLTLNNNAVVTTPNSNEAALSHQVTYTIEAGQNSVVGEALKVTGISGTFTEENDSNVDTKIFDSFAKLADNFADNEIYVDTEAPVIDSYSVTAISDTEHLKDSNYYLNAGDTVTLQVNFKEVVNVIGNSVLTLDSGETAMYQSGDGTNALIYEYKVASGNTSDLKVNANAFPTNIQDKAGNHLAAGKNIATSLGFAGKTIVIDTMPPAAPTVLINDGNAEKVSSVSPVKMTVAGDSGCTIEYSTDAGSVYNTYSGEVSLPAEANKDLNNYKVTARQTDLAGNVSPISALKNVTVDLRPIGLKSISTTKPSGVYKAGATIPLTIEFYKAITSDSDITLTLNNDAIVTFQANGKSVYTVNYVVGASDTNIPALMVGEITGTIRDTATDSEVSSFEGVSGAIANGNVSGIVTANNLPTDSQKAIAIDTVAPAISGYSVRAVSDTEHLKDNSKYYLNAGDTVEIGVTFSEKVTISGNSTLKLNTGKMAVYSGASNDSTTLYYMYTVASGDDVASLGIKKDIYPNNVQDVAGNVLKSGLNIDTELKYGNDKRIVVDTVCAAPVLTGVEKGKVYNTSKSVTLDGEDGATLWYSTDGGATENKLVGNSFTTSDVEGRYQLTGYQIDFAGNKSLWASAVEIVVDTAKPTIKSISTTAGDGVYKTGDTITITAEFSEVVTGENVTVKLNCNTNASVTMNVSNSNNATATYTVVAGDDTSKLAVTGVSGTITDTAENTVSSFSGFSNFDGKNIVIDTKAPTLTGFKVKKYNATSTTEADVNTEVKDVDIGTDIVLVFNERVSKGTGTVTVERVYKSYPAVMETDEYNAHSASISDYYIQRCIGTVDNNGTAPDTDAKYVLKYEIDHGAYASVADISSSNSTQKAVYNYFKDKDYNVTKIDVNSSLITEKADESSTLRSFVTIKLPAKLKKGIIYKVTFTAGTFVDQAGNACAAVTGTDVSFETGPTATPVIRINKKSGQGSGNQPYTTGVKVSSEMHDAELYFAQSNNPVNNDSNSVDKVKNPTSFASYSSEETLKVANDQDGAIFKLWAYATKDGLTDGEVYKELAFKTVIKLSGSSHYVRGSDSTGGVSATTEFPASWYDSLPTAQGGSSCWVTWHILKSFQWKEYNPKASIENNIDKRWIGNENEVTKPGSCDSIDVAEVDGGDSGDGVTITVSWTANYNVWDTNAYVYAWVWNGPNGDKFVSCSPNHNGSEKKVTFVLPAGYKSFKLVRLSENTPDWNKKWNESSNVDNVSGTSYIVTF